LATTPLRLALIGMSGTGKTFWSNQLAKYGCSAISCDEQIERRLGRRLAEGGYAGVGGVAAWMGWPDRPTYREREAEYLSAEIQVLDQVLTSLERDPSRSLILDTTGSVIYAGNNLLYRLRKQMKVVYLAARDAEHQLLIERYLEDPKPVLWRRAYVSRNGETPRETVLRCYPALIESRRRSYEALAHVTLPLEQLRGAAADAGKFLALVEER
jgi:shikimate kinase